MIPTIRRDTKTLNTNVVNTTTELIVGYVMGYRSDEIKFKFVCSDMAT
jgi:hypothetical protein